MDVLHRALLVLAKAQYGKARAHQGLWVHFDVPKDASLPPQALAMTLKKGAHRHRMFFGNVVSFAAKLILTVQAAQEGWADRSGFFVGLYSNQSHVFDFWVLVGWRQGICFVF